MSQEVRLVAEHGARLRPLQPPSVRQVLPAAAAQAMDVLSLHQTTVSNKRRLVRVHGAGIFLHPVRGVNTPYFFTYTPTNLIW